MTERWGHRLLIVFPGAAFGGCEQYGLVIAAACRAAGWNVLAAIRPDPSLRTLADRLRDVLVDVTAWELGGTSDASWYGSFESQQSTAADLLLRWPPDGVVAALPMPACGIGLIAACADGDVPAAVCFQLCREDSTVPDEVRVRCQAAYAGRQRWFAAAAWTARCVEGAFQLPGGSVEVVYNGVEASGLPPLSWEERRSVRREVGVPADAPMLLAVGRLTGQKDHRLIIDAMARMRRDMPDVQLVIAGEGDLRGPLMRQAGRLRVAGNVHLLGQRNDVSTLLRACDVFVFPSVLEASSFALLEAMAHGCAIVASDIASNRELITHRVEGCLFARGDAGALVSTLRWALANPTDMMAMGGRARARAAERFTRERMVEGTLQQLTSAQRVRRHQTPSAE